MFGKFSFFLPQGSRWAEQVDLVFFGLTAMTLFFTVLIVAMITYFTIKYRRRPGGSRAEFRKEEPWYIELVWSIVPFGIALTLFAWGAKIFLKLYEPPPAGTIEIYATAKQWMWKFQHPEGRREINHLHLPVGKPVRVTMISQDVIHSFFVPVFRIKHDVLPYRYTSVWFEPTLPGTYHLFCAEYCGTEHSRMVGTVTVMDPQDYQAWLASPLVEGESTRDASDSVVAAGGGTATAADRGKAVLEARGCRACHQIGNNTLAPQLEGIYGTKQPLASGSAVTADDNYIRESILNPTAKVVAKYQPVMPPFQGVITEEEIRDVIQYIKATSGGKK